MMKFQFDSVSDFLMMAGHGPYVWACYGVGLLALGYLALTPIMARKKFLMDLQRTIKIEAQEKQRMNTAANTE